MPFAIAHGLLLAVLAGVPLAALWVAMGGRGGEKGGGGGGGGGARWPHSERALVATMLLVALLLAEMLLVGLALPATGLVERPLRTWLPLSHYGMVAASLAYLFFRRARLMADVASVRARARRLAASTGPWGKAAALATLASLAISLSHALWNAADEHDGALYRKIVAVQPFQDGRIGRIEFPWDSYADAYPRTVELLYSWTMIQSGTSVGFHLVNWCFLLVLGLSGYVMARRLGLNRRAALLGCALTVTTPLPSYLTSVLYNDLVIAAMGASAVALAMQPRRGSWKGLHIWGWALAAGLAASAKVTAALLIAVIGIVRLVGMLVPRRRVEIGPIPDRGHLPTFVLASLVAATCASAAYIRSWVLYTSPTWPVRISFGDLVIFDGPLVQERLMITAHGPWLPRWGTAIYKVFNTVSQDANGSFGLLFGIAVIPAAIVFAARAVARPDFNRVLLAASFWVLAIIPVATNLRYSLHALPVGYAMLLWTAAGLRQWRRRRGKRGHAPIVVGAVVLLLLVTNVVDYARTVAKEVAEQVRWGASLVRPERNRLWYSQFMYVEPGMAPEVHSVVYRTVTPGGRLMYAVGTLSGLLYDPAYTYAIEYRSIGHWRERGGRGSVGASGDESRLWIDSLVRDGATEVLVYRGSPEDAAAAAAGFELVYDQGENGRWPGVRMYRVGLPR